jgi:hypothetical protein
MFLLITGGLFIAALVKCRVFAIYYQSTYHLTFDCNNMGVLGFPLAERQQSIAPLVSMPIKQNISHL